jgi:hypothetical protein
LRGEAGVNDDWVEGGVRHIDFNFGGIADRAGHVVTIEDRGCLIIDALIGVGINPSPASGKANLRIAIYETTCGLIDGDFLELQYIYLAL